MEMFPLDAQLAVAASLHFKDYTRNDYIMEFLITDKYSQECAKASVPDIFSIPIQANKARQIMGVSFQFNNTVTKIDRELNTKRNVHSWIEVAGSGNSVMFAYLQHELFKSRILRYLVGLLHVLLRSDFRP